MFWKDRESSQFLVSSLAAFLLVPCTLGCQPAAQPTRPTVSLRMRGTPPDATVIIDDEAVGTLDFVAARGVALPPGVHHVTVEAGGYLPWDHEVRAELGSPPIRLDVTLTPVPD